MIEPFKKICIDLNDAKFLIYETERQKKEILPVLHSHTYYEIHYVHENENIHYFPDGELEIKSGEFLIIPPGKSHYALTNIKGYVIAVSIEKNGDKGKFFEYFKCVLDNASLRVIKANESLSEAICRFSEIKYEKGEMNFLENFTWGCEFLKELFSVLENFDKNGQSTLRIESDMDEISVALEVFVNNISITIEEMARRLNYSKRHISRLIKQKYGMPLKKIRAIRMVETAKWLLKNENLTVKEVAQKSGFSSFKVFSQKFKEYENCTPSGYRRKIKNESDY